MAFWIFMFIMNLLIPIVMILVGISFRKSAPKDINNIYGYRTKMSMKNRDTWEFAHRHCGKIWATVGLVIAPLSAIPLLFVLGKSKEVVGATGSLICSIQVAILILSILPTELALNKFFDKDGNKFED